MYKTNPKDKPKKTTKIIWKPLPHISYGNYGGYKYGCKTVHGDVGPNCPLPIDTMDALFVRHDKESGSQDPMADFHLAGNLLLKANPITTKFTYPVFGRAYWFGALIYSGVSAPFSWTIRKFFVKKKK